jgi:hypothetical protein
MVEQVELRQGAGYNFHLFSSPLAYKGRYNYETRTGETTKKNKTKERRPDINDKNRAVQLL